MKTEEQKDLVSIIVPVYNTEKYLEQCLDSLVNLKYNNTQIIIVDDGSNDGSGNICDTYATQNKNIEVYHIKNGGVSHARNIGLDHVKGKYLFFVDSDDFVKDDFVLKLLIKNNEDFVYGGFSGFKDGQINGTVKYKKEYFSISELKENLGDIWCRVPFLFVHGCCFKFDIIKNNHIRFDEEISMGEDTRFNFKYLEYCQHVRVDDSCGYYYRDQPQSTIHRFHPDRLQKERMECEWLEKFCGKRNGRLEWSYWHIVLQHYYHHKKVCNDYMKKRKIIRLIKLTYADSFFRFSINYIRQNGTLDEKIETYFMNYYLHNLYNICLKLLELIWKIKMNVLKS